VPISCITFVTFGFIYNIRYIFIGKIMMIFLSVLLIRHTRSFKILIRFQMLRIFLCAKFSYYDFYFQVHLYFKLYIYSKDYENHHK